MLLFCYLAFVLTGQTYFDGFFGIITPDDVSPEKVILSFDVVQGKYIKTLPLHTTQEVILENENEIRIALNLSHFYPCSNFNKSCCRHSRIFIQHH
jgi:hypothetical protein